MKRRVELPLIDPMYSTYHSQGAGCAILGSNPSIKNWYLNDIMHLCCSRRFLFGYTTPELGIDGSTWNENPFIEKHPIQMRFVNGYINPIIREFLDNGYYVFYWGVDDYYLEGKSWYHTHHGEHDGLIYGYDQNAKTYLLHAYDINWVYNTFPVSQTSFNKGREAIFKEGSYGGICGIKPIPDYVPFEPEKIFINFSKYLNSTFEQYPDTEDGSVYGTIVHNYVARYIEMLIDGTIPYHRMDRRIMRMIWEQKRVMLERLEKLEEFFGLGTKVSDQYKHVVENANSTRMLYASHHLRRRDSVLPIIKKKIINIQEAETKLLENILKQTEGLL